MTDGTRLGAWAAAVLALVLCAGSAAAEDAGARGKELYQLCAQCHGPDGAGDSLALAPPIAGLSEWYLLEQLNKFRIGARGLHPDDLGGLRMYPMSQSLYPEGDLEAVAAYVATLPASDPEPTLEGGDAARGKALYTPCAACHGAQGEGMQVLGGPNLRVSTDWYMLTQLEHFKSGVRGTHPKDLTGARMRPMAMTLADEQAMLDVIAYIMTLGE